MPCSICHQSGHNRATCPQRVNITGLPLAPPVNRGLSLAPPVNRVSELQNIRRLNGVGKRRFRESIKNVINLKKFVKVSTLLYYNNDDLKYNYYHWLKVKDLKGHLNESVTDHWKHQIYIYSASIIGGIINISDILYYLVLTKNTCCMYHNEMNPVPVKDDNKKIELMNLKDTNYLIYWVVGNYLVTDIDSSENPIKYMGMLSKKGSFKLKTLDGHRFYLIPHRLDIEPPYHPMTDKQFLIEPYCHINIHDGIKDKVFIDDEDKLSELNQWKFNALKLDYLIREVIKLGGKNNDVLECVLDLHEDIKLRSVSEIEKDMAGIPSSMTNIT